MGKKIMVVDTSHHDESSILESHRENRPSGSKDSSSTSRQDIELLVQHLSSRVEKLENLEISNTKLLENATEKFEKMDKNEKTIWQNYDERLTAIEKNLNDETMKNSKNIETIRLEFRGLRELYDSLKICCDDGARLSNVVEMNKNVERATTDYFESGMAREKLRAIVESIIRTDHDEMTKKIFAEKIEKTNNEEIVCKSENSLSNDDMKKIVNEVLKIYDADKTGRVDYALESAGGQIISTRCTQRYNVNTRAFKLLGFTLYYESNNPRTVIQGNSLQPGACWAFQDFPGYLLIKLRGFVRVNGFTIEHVPRSILPNSEMRSAPRKFNVWGLKDENDAEPVMFGDYEFLDSDDNLQYFPVQNVDIATPYEYVELRIHSNHGQLEYTCLYRFRVHGTPV